MDHTKMIDSSLSQLMDLAAERDRIEHKMGKLHLAARGLLNLVDDKAQREAYKAMLDNFKVRIGLTDLIRLCLMLSEKPMTPVQIRNFIIDFGSEASSQQNLLQSVHTILKRNEGEMVKEEVNADGEKAYRLVTMAETLIRTGVAPISAQKVGGQIEDKFDLTKVWSDLFGTQPNVFQNLDALPPDARKKILEDTMHPRTRPRKTIGQRLAERAKEK